MKIFLGLLVLSSISMAQNLQVLDSALAIKTSYITSEFEGPIAYWLIDGQVYSLKETRDQILNHNRVACVSWLMNFSDDKSVSKEALQQALLPISNNIPLWKNISGRPVFMDTETSFALSFNCVGKGFDGELIEVDSADYLDMFKGVFLFR
jgi:hypothetical protein